MIQHTFNRELPLWSFDFRSASRLDILSRRDVEQKIIKKSWEDIIFKIRLLNDAKRAIEGFFSVSFPESLKIEILQESEDLVYLVLPHNPYEGSTEPELKKSTGMDLEDIAGWMLDQQKGFLPEDRSNSVLLVAKAWRDATFKAKLLADPKTVLEQELGLVFREDVALRVRDESENKVYIVIPFLPDHTLATSEADLHSVNLPIVIGSISPIPTDTFALDCTMTFTCPIP